MIKQWTFQGELVEIEQGRNLEERMIQELCSIRMKKSSI